ncbi:SMI1/KNR4 family protein [Flavobacterium tyrosinilyticum]|uniref:SMI1/KNR4 family protein n=1 Tax=Flavobacterium tyrosinilyticum TaxID=1658740 RepID=UPI00203000B1|nr:SMI1/KNR4 family protein [Flavobacterium tyrosinilyticum]MCM0667755.1 SMI1/KNR4 family protein [Flavobacterium tyrosinilyticum]
MRYTKEIYYLKKNNLLEENRYIISEKEVLEIKKFRNNIPEEFIDFLKEIGGGQFKNSQYEIKNFVFDFYEIGLENDYAVDESIVLFGNSFGGDFIGFDLSKTDPTVIEIDHVSGEIFDTNKSFQEFFREDLGMDF